MDSARRLAQYKKGVSAASGQRSRADATLALRKKKQIEALHKRRHVRAAQLGVGVPGVAPAAAAAPAVATPSDDTFAQYVAAMMSGDAEANYKGTFEIRKLLSKEQDPPVQQVLDAGVLPRLVEFLHNTNDKLQFEAAWAITNIASTEHTSTVVGVPGCVDALVSYCRSPSPDVREQCLWCLGNIAGDGPAFRDLVLSKPGAVENLLLNIQNPANESLLKNATWTLSNYCRGKPQPSLELVKPLIPALCHLLSATDTEILTDACWGLSYLTDGDDARIQAVVDSGIVPRLVQLLGHPTAGVVVPALRTCGNIVTGNDVQTQAVIDAGGLVAFSKLITHDRRALRREACWASSNVAAGTPKQIATLVDTPNLMKALIHQLDKGDWNVRKESAWAVSNVLTSGGDECIFKTVQAGAIAPMLKVLKVEDIKIVTVGLEALTAILEAEAPPSAGGQTYSILVEKAGGIDVLEELQEHDSTEIYEKAVALLEAHYGGSAEDDENIAPAVTENGKTFSFGFGAAFPSAAPSIVPQQPNPFGGFAASAAPPAPTSAAPPVAAGGFDFSGMTFK